MSNQLSLFPDFEYEGLIKKRVPFVSEVEEFNALMNKPNNYEPTIPEKKEWEFVYNFVLEELEEYKQACENGDIVEILDALCDITYVSLGNATMLHGLKDKIWSAYQEVQASNLSKACKTIKEAEDTVLLRSKEQGEPCHWEKVDDMYIVYRTRDRKVLKSISYFKPNLHQFFTNEELFKINQ
jgi:predicted HAD superfamily Cof-like phosphohydrolase